MEYVPPISIFPAGVVLFIPIGVSVVHAIRTWRPRVRWRSAAAGDLGAVELPSNSIDSLRGLPLTPELFDNPSLLGRVGNEFDMAAVVNV